MSSGFLKPVEAAGVPIINLHPALPGQYDGAGAIKRAHDDFLAGKIKNTGIMIHYVVEEVDRFLWLTGFGHVPQQLRVNWSQGILLDHSDHVFPHALGWHQKLYGHLRADQILVGEEPKHVPWHRPPRLGIFSRTRKGGGDENEGTKTTNK